MSNIMLGKSKRGRVWHILEWDLTLCGDKVGIDWSYTDFDKDLKLCTRCAREYDSILEKVDVEVYGEKPEPAKPVKGTNPHQSWS